MSNFNINFEHLCSLPGRNHVYWYDKESILLGCNELQLKQFNRLYNKKKQDMIGNTIHGFLDKADKNFADAIYQENQQVLQEERPKQFYNILTVPGICKIKLLTIKNPYYHKNGQLAGVFGISQYLSEISLKDIKNFNLSKRETQCLTLILKGKSMREIAGILHISRRTVETYIENIKDKLGCHTKSELISKSFELGISDEIFA